MGGLLTPCAVTVICAVPVGPGAQTVGLLREFQIPAHTEPLFEIVATVGLLDSKLKVSVTTWFRTFLAVAVKVWNFPDSSETFRPLEQLCANEAHRLTLAGIWLVTTFVGLLLLQATQRTQLMRAYARSMEETSLPMNPSTMDLERQSCSGKLSV